MTAKKKATSAESSPAPKPAPAAKPAKETKAAAPKKAEPVTEVPAAPAPAPAPKAKASAKKASTPAPLSPELQYLQIQEAAYYLAEKDGFTGNPYEYWLQAEASLKTHLS